MTLSGGRYRHARGRATLAALMAACLAVAGCAGVLSDPVVPGLNDRSVKQDVSMPEPPPPPPDDRQLQTVYVGVANRNQYALDRSSLVTSDRVFARFTLVITTPGGVRNVSHDAIRCDQIEHKLLAIGNSDGSWTRVALPAWRPIGTRSTAAPALVPIYRALCEGSSLATYPDRAVRELDRVVGTGREAIR